MEQQLSSVSNRNVSQLPSEHPVKAPCKTTQQKHPVKAALNAPPLHHAGCVTTTSAAFPHLSPIFCLRCCVTL